MCEFHKDQTKFCIECGAAFVPPLSERHTLMRCLQCRLLDDTEKEETAKMDEYVKVELNDLCIPEEMSEKTVQHKDIYESILNEYISKNMDYGNSFNKIYNEFGLESTAIRLSDKINRLVSLCQQEQRVEDESIDDTLRDIINYSIMTLMLRQ